MGQGQSDSSHHFSTNPKLNLPHQTPSEKEPENHEPPLEIFTLHAGLEEQLEISFTTLDVESEGVLPYSSLEPVLRHHLMQIGLLEYMSRFTHSDGSLKFSAVSTYLTDYKLTATSSYTMEDWKNLVLAWIRLIEKTKQDDIIKWQESIRRYHEIQEQELNIALREFEKHYILQLESYYKEIDAVNAKEEAYRKEWEKNLDLQEQFYKSQMDTLQQKNDEALDEYSKQTKHKVSVFGEYMKQLNIGERKKYGNMNVVTFCYPSGLTQCGAPISCGAPTPYRRRRNN